MAVMGKRRICPFAQLIVVERSTFAIPCMLRMNILLTASCAVAQAAGRMQGQADLLH
jgi:hypothetical protein